MNIIIFLILSFLKIPYTQADSFHAQMIETEPLGNISLLKFSNGRVAFTDRDLVHLKHFDLKITVDEKQNLISLTEVDNPLTQINKLHLNNFNSPINPPTLISPVEAQKIFDRLNSNYKRSSECSNRAHVWAWEEFKKNKITSEKVYVLFTASYINRHRFKWWFHVAPVFSVKNGNTIEKMVFDFMFTPGPVTIKQWTDGFVFSKRSCRYTEKFSEYDVNPQTEDCYLMIDSMFTWNPIDMKNQELYGQFKTQFSLSEINFAYKQAFK